MIRTIDELVDALGGVVEVGRWLGIGKQAVSNWSMRGYIPPAWHLRLFLEIQKRGLCVAPAVFGLSDEDVVPLFGAMVARPRGLAMAAR